MTEPQFSRFDHDPEAVTWARTKIEHEIDHLTRWRDQAKAEGKTEQAQSWRRIASYLDRHLIGGEGCTIAAFDERLPKWADQLDTPATPADALPMTCACGRDLGPSNGDMCEPCYYAAATEEA